MGETQMMRDALDRIDGHAVQMDKALSAAREPVNCAQVVSEEAERQSKLGRFPRWLYDLRGWLNRLYPLEGDAAALPVGERQLIAERRSDDDLFERGYRPLFIKTGGPMGRFRFKMWEHTDSDFHARYLLSISGDAWVEVYALDKVEEVRP
jgi:hypothetical protein